MLWLIGLACFSREEPPPPTGPLLEPGTYSFYPGQPPGCVDEPPAVQLVHLGELTPILGTVLNRSGRFHEVDVRGTRGWIATAHVDDPRILTVLSADEPTAECLQAAITPLGDDRWFSRTSAWLAALNLTTSEARRLAPTSGDLQDCAVQRSAIVCRGPAGPVRFDRDGVVIAGDYDPTWRAVLRP